MEKILIKLHFYIINTRIFNYLWQVVSTTSWWKKTGMNISDFECYFNFFLLLLLCLIANRIKRILRTINYYL